MAESQGAEAFVEVNDPHVAVRMRCTRPKGFDSAEWQSMLMADARSILDHVNPKWFDVKKPRPSTSDTHRAAYFELLNLEDSNAVADKLKAKLKDLGYKLTQEKFPV